MVYGKIGSFSCIIGISDGLMACPGIFSPYENGEKPFLSVHSKMDANLKVLGIVLILQSLCQSGSTGFARGRCHAKKTY
jgi:hypothetical protein